MATTLIHFPSREDPAEVHEFRSLAQAERFADDLNGTIYIFGRPSAKALVAMTVSELNRIYNQHFSFPEPVFLKHRRDLAERCSRIVPALAESQGHALRRGTMSDEKTQETKTATKKRSKKSTSKKSTKKSAKKESKPAGRHANFAGKKIVKTEAGEAARRQEGSRRTASWNAFRSGMKYETCVEKGAHPDDLLIFVRAGHAEATD